MKVILFNPSIRQIILFLHSSALTQLQMEVKFSLPEWECGMGTPDSAGAKGFSFAIAECHFRSYHQAMARQSVGRNQGPVFLAGCQLHTESKVKIRLKNKGNNREKRHDAIRE